MHTVDVIVDLLLRGEFHRALVALPGQFRGAALFLALALGGRRRREAATLLWRRLSLLMLLLHGHAHVLQRENGVSEIEAHDKEFKHRARHLHVHVTQYFL